jgi:hypothetical protein
LRRRQLWFLKRQFLREEISAAPPETGFGATAIDLDLGRATAIAIDFNLRLLAVAGQGNARLLAVTRERDPIRFGSASVDLDYGSFVARRRIIVASDRRNAPDKAQTRECEKHPSHSRASLWPGRGHRGAKNAGKRFPLASLTPE